jgi:hypothetical protein
VLRAFDIGQFIVEQSPPRLYKGVLWEHNVLGFGGSVLGLRLDGAHDNNECIKIDISHLVLFVNFQDFSDNRNWNRLLLRP